MKWFYLSSLPAGVKTTPCDSAFPGNMLTHSLVVKGQVGPWPVVTHFGLHRTGCDWSPVTLQGL